MKNWKSKAVSTALALSILVPTAAYAADTVTTTDMPFKKVFTFAKHLNTEDRQALEDKTLELVSKYTPESLDAWKSALAEQAKLGEELKAKMPARPELSAEIKEQLTAIRDKVKSGELTQEQAKAEYEKLGIKVNFSSDKQKPELSAEVKEQLTAIRDKVKNGELTQEQAKAEFEKLGLKGQIVFDRGNNPMGQLKQAVEDNDEAKIKELLPQLLTQLQEKNQKMGERLAQE